MENDTGLGPTNGIKVVNMRGNGSTILKKVKESSSGQTEISTPESSSKMRDME